MDKITEYRINNNLCIRCGQTLDRVGRYCIKCNIKRNITIKKKAREKHKSGICIICTSPLDREGWYCSNCTEYLREIAKGRINRLKKDGLCIQCGKKAAAGKARCESCLDAQKNIMRKIRFEKKIDKFISDVINQECIYHGFIIHPTGKIEFANPNHVEHLTKIHCKNTKGVHKKTILKIATIGWLCDRTSCIAVYSDGYFLSEEMKATEKQEQILNKLIESGLTKNNNHANIKNI